MVKLPEASGIAQRTLPRPTDTPFDRASVITAGGVFVPASLCERLWRVLHDAEMRGRANGGGLMRPDLRELMDVLRQATATYLAAALSVRGHDSTPLADIGASSDLSGTAGLADALGVSERHARRIAISEGIAPVARNAWRRNDIAALVARRQRKAAS